MFIKSVLNSYCKDHAFLLIKFHAGGKYPGGNILLNGGKCPGGKCPGGKCPGGKCPDTSTFITIIYNSI